METLFLADDERSIREGLKYILDWEALGFSICGEAGTGEEALQKLITLNPSLALLDVRMPKMTGTEVLRRARSLGFTGRCIILSGYSDFSYAQEAIENGVSFYITKPLDEDELYNAVCKIKEEIDIEKKQSSHFVEFKSKAKEVILKEFTYGTQTDELSNDDLELLHLCEDCFQIAIATGFHKDLTESYSLTDLLKVSKKEDSCFETIWDGALEIVLLKGTHGINRFLDLLEHFDDELQEGSPLFSLFVTYGEPVSKLTEISKSYQQAKDLLSRRFFCPMDRHYMGQEEQCSPSVPNKAPSQTELVQYAEKLTNYIQSFNHKQIADTLQSVTEYLINTTNDIEVIKMFLTDLYWQVKERIIRVYPNTDIPFPSASAVIRFIADAHYLSEIIRYLSEQCSMIMNATGNPSRDTILDDVLYYIDHNYSDNIKLETIAPLFGYNSAYLGKIFHKTVGESFNSYIDRKRIEASKKLLENKSLKVYEISSQIGYKNVDYFHKKFRKYVGLSPAEYRNSSGTNNTEG